VSKGVLIFAINSTFDYVAAAKFAAKQAKKYLGLPVTLVTNSRIDDECFDSVVYIDDTSNTMRNYISSTGATTSVQWFNESRIKAYDLSPYDQTLLIDADYFMFNSSLATIFDTNSEIACFSEINDITGSNSNLVRLSEISIPMQWATVLYFTKCPLSKAVFDFMQQIKSEWRYYSLLYSFRNDNFRNDFALSIALQALTGYSTLNFNVLPGRLHSIFSNTNVVSVNDSEVVYSWNNQISKISNTNIHCLNKVGMEKFYA